MTAICTFVFDVIVVRLNLNKPEYEDAGRCTVDVSFKDISLNITSSRINVQNFRSGRSCEFNASPNELINDLENNPLKFKVRYDQAVVAEGEIIWPHAIISEVSSTMKETTHMEVCGLQQNNDDVGEMEILMRLFTKCQEYGDDDGVMVMVDDSVPQNLRDMIDEQDVLFVVGDNQKASCCLDLLDVGAEYSDIGGDVCEGADSASLDLSRYRCLNGKLVQRADVLNPKLCDQRDRCDSKNMSQDYDDAMKMCSECSKQDKDPRNVCAALYNAECAEPAVKCTSETSQPYSDHQTPQMCRCFPVQDSEEDTYPGFNTPMVCDDDAPQLMQTEFGTNRYCPVCKESMAWLPKLAACPKCGYKPVPRPREKPYNHKRTADEILRGYMECSTSSELSSPNDDECKETCQEDKSKCRCTCKCPGRPCPFCRIRKLCADVFQSDRGKEKTDTKKKINNYGNRLMELDEKTLGTKTCDAIEEDSNTYLAQIFAELKELYDVQPVKPGVFFKDPKCEKALHEPASRKGGPKTARAPAKGQTSAAPKQRPRSLSPAAYKTKATKRTPSAESKRVARCKAHDATRDAARAEISSFCQPKKFGQKPIKKRCRPPLYKYCVKFRGFRPNIKHQNCIGSTGRRNVPRHMGWLWSADQEVCRGWKPGAIRRPIRELMRYFLKDYPADTVRVSQYSYRKNNKPENQEDCDLVQKPTLHIYKKNDVYTITLRPLKDADALKNCADPYMKMKPIRFRITKNPMVVALSKLKKDLKDMGFAKCTCHKPVVQCYCRNFIEKKRLCYKVNKECRMRNIPNCTEKLVLTDTSDSEVEYDFGVTPPAGVVKPERLHKPNMVNHGTQYLESDWKVPPVFPPPSKYTKFFNCITGTKYENRPPVPFDITGGGDRNEVCKTQPDKKRKGDKKPPAVRLARKPQKKQEEVPKKKMTDSQFAISKSMRYLDGQNLGGIEKPVKDKVKGKKQKDNVKDKGKDKGAKDKDKGKDKDKSKEKFKDQLKDNMKEQVREPARDKPRKVERGSKATARDFTKAQMRLKALGEIPPPLLCMVDRRGKPDPCYQNYMYCQ